MVGGPADDETVKMGPAARRPDPPAAKPNPPAPRKPKPALLGGAIGAVVVLALGAWLLLGRTPAPPAGAPQVASQSAATAPTQSPAAQPASAPQLAVRDAAEAEILAHQATSLTLFRFQPNPRILVLDFPDLRQQGLMLNRAAALIEKKGLPRDRVLTDAELDSAIAAKGDTMETYYYGHDYPTDDLVRFFRLADAQGLKLRPEEETLRAILRQTGAFAPGANMALISIPRVGSGEGVDLGMRTAILRHELSHGEFFTNPTYVAYVRRFWETGLDEPMREAFRRYLVAQDYDITLADLTVNEMQAYLMHTPDPRLFGAASIGVSADRFAQAQAAFLLGMPAGWLRDCTPGPGATVIGVSKPRRRRSSIQRRRRG